MTTYPGGKGTAYHKLINLMPPHSVYIESHLGAGSVMKAKRPANLNIGIDLNNTVLAQTAKEILPDALTIFSDGHRQVSPNTMIGAGITRTDDASCNYIFYSCDAVQWLRGYPCTGDELVYSDPPYLMAVRKSQERIYYDYEYTDDDHIQMLTLYKTLPCMVMVSGYYSEMYQDMLSGWHTYTFQSMTRGGTLAEEWVWMNYPTPVRLHDYQYLGSGFRERERIRKKKTRWVNKLRNLPTHEQQAILWAMRESGLIS